MKSGEKFKNIYMEETSPHNPFGPNYHGLSIEKKIGFKFSSMKAFIKPSKEDLVRKEEEELKFVGTLLLSVSLSVFVGGAIKMYLSNNSGCSKE